MNCKHCENKFNKSETLQKHMEKFHKENLIQESAKSRKKETMEVSKQDDLPKSQTSQTLVIEVQQGATRLRNNKILHRA